MWTNLKRVTAPADPLLSLDETKAHLRLDHDDDDDLITTLIEVATAFIEGPNGIGIALVTQEWRLSLDGFHRAALIPLGPVQDITSIEYHDAAGEPQVLDPTAYVTDLDTSPAVIVPRAGTSFPATERRPGAVKITFIAGYGEPQDVPADIRHAALLMIGLWYSTREDATASNLHSIPLGSERVLAKYRVL